MEDAATQVLGNVDGRGIERESALHPTGALNPVDMVVGALAQKNRHRVAQLGDAPVALDQLGSGPRILGVFNQAAYRLTHVLQRPRDIVFHEIGLADAQLAPVALAARGFFVLRITGGFHRAKKFLGLLQRLGDVVHQRSLA